MNYQNKYKYVKKGWNSRINSVDRNLRKSWEFVGSHKSDFDRGIKSINPIIKIIGNMLKYGKLSKRIVL